MTRYAYVGLWAAMAVLLAAGSGLAQQPGQSLPGIDQNLQWRLERLGDTHWKLTGDVEIEKDDMKISADEVEIFTDKDLLTAKGNVTLTTATQRISADSLEFNLKTKLGTFHHASGSARIHDEEQEAKPKSQFGTQEPEVLFYGETLEKIGERKYRITKGGFTTCVQPKPRWEMTSGTTILNIDHYAMLQNMVMHVKGVPVFYLPIIYYPINKEDRATGFLLPMYGSSSLRGHTFNNAFFWAINRSQDATFLYDWFSKTGQGFGSEYRYVRSGGSNGDARFYVLNEKPTTYLDTTGATVTAAGRKSFEARGGMSQTLPFRLRARARVDYFSDISVQQTYNTNIYDASRRQRSFNGNVAGNWGTWGMTASVDHAQYFFNGTDSTTNGSLPRISINRGEKPIKGTPIYFGVSTEYAGLVRKTVSGTTTYDSGLSRIDATPTVRFPFRKFPFFTVNSSLGWRVTWWSESLDLTSRQQVPTSVSRNYFDMQARIVGPVFNKIWNRPNSKYTEKIKHTVEPWVNLQRVTAIDNTSQIVLLDSTDYIIGGTTRITYGVNNRFYAKKKDGPQAGRAQEILNVAIRQTYYSDARASAIDPAYGTSFTTSAIQKLSPVSLAARVTPTDTLGGTLRAEYNTYVKALMTIGAVGSYSYKENFNLSAGWSQRRFIPNLAGYDTASNANHYLNADANLKFARNKVGAQVSFNYDLRNSLFLQRRFVGYYNAQCCGISFEYQNYNFAGITYSNGYKPPVTSDRRFSVAITLAGIGSFSPFFGAMGGNQSNTYR